MPIAEIASLVADVLVSIAAAVTATVAIIGIGSWRRELRGRVGFDTARKLLLATYAVRNQISYFRSPWVSGTEFPENYDSLNANAQEKGEGWGYVYGNRWKPLGEALSEFDLAVLEAEVLWGESIRESAMEIRRCISSLRADVSSFISNEYSGGEEFRDDRDYALKVRAGLNEIKPEENELSLKIKSAVETIEKQVKPHLPGS